MKSLPLTLLLAILGGLAVTCVAEAVCYFTGITKSVPSPGGLICMLTSTQGWLIALRRPSLFHVDPAK